MPDHLLLDVFTDRPFTGNPLAVAIDPGALDTTTMQAIAGELNLSETVFVWSPTEPGGGWPTRIFTPGSELPFAGHPTVGAAFALVATGRVPIEGAQARLVLDEGAGPVSVVVECADGRPVSARLTTPRRPEPVPVGEPAALAAALGLRPDQLHPSLPVAGWSAGVPFSIVPVRDVEALGAIRVDAAAWASGLTEASAAEVYAVTPLGDPATATEWRARMFAPALGIPEDPATGAAAAAFAGFLAELDPAPGARGWVVHQGVEMGRPSRIEVTVHRPDGGGAPTAVEVGGAAVVVGRGQIDVAP